MLLQNCALQSFGKVRTKPVFVGADTQTFAANLTSVSIDLTALSGGLAAAPAGGDLVIVAFAVVATSDIDFTSAIADGWTIRFDQYVDDNFDTNIVLAYKKMGASPDTTLTVHGGTQVTDPAIAMVQAWRSTSRDSIAATMLTLGIQNTILVNPPVPIASPTSLGAVQLVFAAGAGSFSNSPTYSSSFYTGYFASLGKGQSTPSTAGVVAAHGWKLWASGADDAPAFTFSGTDSVNDSCYAATIILEGN